MSETKEVFRIDKPGAYKTQDGQVVDIVEVTITGRSVFGWFRTDTAPCPLRRWDASGHGYIPIPYDIIEAIPFVVDGPGRYMMRDGQVINVVSIQPLLSRYPVRGEASWCWTMDGLYDRCESSTGKDLVRKMHPLEQEPGAKASEEQKAPEIKKEPKKPTVAITHLGKYRARNGFFVDITHIGQETAIGVFYNQDAEPFAWLRDGRFNEHCESDEDIVEKIEQREETKTLDPVAKWSEEAMQHIEEYVGIMKKEGKPMDPLIEEALRVFRPDLCPPNAGQEKTGAEVLSALGKAATKVADEPKKRSAGFDMVMIQNHGALHHITVAGVYSINNGVATVLPVEGDMTQVAIVCGKFPEQHNVMMLTKGDRVTCPAHNVTCVIHCGLEE